MPSNANSRTLSHVTGLPTLDVAGFFLNSRCTRRAHAALQSIDKLKLSVQSIMGATANLQRKSFISLIYFSSVNPLCYWTDRGIRVGN